MDLCEMDLTIIWDNSIHIMVHVFVTRVDNWVSLIPAITPFKADLIHDGLLIFDTKPIHKRSKLGLVIYLIL